MVTHILNSVGNFSDEEVDIFEKYVLKRSVKKNDILLREGDVCRSLFYILSGCGYQFQDDETMENIIDLHLANEWMYNHPALINQSPSKTCIKVFSDAEILELPLYKWHRLIARSQAFLQLGKILDQESSRTHFFDHSLTPAEKYAYITANKPALLQAFPLKMIASYLKIAPETLSRVRAAY